jgi:hypothetical protein
MTSGREDQPLTLAGRPLPRTDVRVRVELHVDILPGSTAAHLEDAIAAEGRRASRELFEAAMRTLDEMATEASGATRQRLEPRWVATLFGRVKVRRYRVRGASGSFHPLDRMYGLERSEASPGLRAVVHDLASELPARRVADVVTQIGGESFAHQSVWRLLHEDPSDS